MVLFYRLSPLFFNGFFPDFWEQDISKIPLIQYIASDIYGNAWLLLQMC